MRLIFHLAVTNACIAIPPLQVFRVVVDAALEYLDDVPAERTAERFADLADLEVVHDLFEFRNEGTRVRPSEVAADGSRRAIRQQFRQLAEIFAFLDAFERVVELLLGRRVVNDFIRRDQYVTRLGLVDLAALDGAPEFVHLDDMKAARGAKRLRDVTGLHVRKDVYKERRNLLSFDPAEGAAAE